MQFVKDAISGADIAPLLRAQAIACLPASLPPAGDGLVFSQLALLWYSLSPLFCEWTRLCIRLETFTGKFSLFFSLSLAIPQFGLLSHISYLRLSSGHSGPVLTLSMQPVPPCLAPAHWWQMRASGLLLHWELWIATYSAGFFFFSLPVGLSSEIPKLPTDLLVRGFPTIGKHLLHDSLPRMDLCP